MQTSSGARKAAATKRKQMGEEAYRAMLAKTRSHIQAENRQGFHTRGNAEEAHAKGLAERRRRGERKKAHKTRLREALLEEIEEHNNKEDI